MQTKLLATTLLLSIYGAGCALDAADPGDVAAPDEAADLGTVDLALPANARTAFEFFVHKGLTKRQSAGIIGNLMQESGVNPLSKQLDGGPGRGIAQWSVGGRWDTSFHDNMTWYANRHAENRWALSPQLDFVWYELADVGGYGLVRLRHDSTIDGATITFMRYYEICGACDATQREAYAHQVYRAYAGSSAAVEAEAPAGAAQAE